MAAWFFRACAAFTLLTGSVAAEPVVEHVTLDYAGLEACPARAAFEREVRARTRKADFAESADGRRFRVTLEKSDAGFAGELVIVDADGATSARRIDGKDCDDVVSALALVAALAVDPDASTAPASELDLDGASAAPAILQPFAPAVPVASDSRAPAEPARLELAAGLAAGVLDGPAPEPLFVAGPRLNVLRTRAAWRPSVRIGLFAAQTGVVGPSDDRARFRFAGARIELCPQRLELGEALELFACLVTDVGALDARGRGIATERSATRFWLSSGLGLGAEYRLSSKLSLGLLLGESVNFTRDEFVFLDPRVSVHDVPLASQSALLGLDWHFD